MPNSSVAAQPTQAAEESASRRHIRPAFIGPWIALLFPSRGIMHTVSAARGALVFSMLAHALLFGPLVILLISYGNTAYVHTNPTPAFLADGDTPGQIAVYEVRFKPLLAEVARWFESDRDLARTGFVCLFTFLLSSLLCAILIPILLPRVKQHEPLSEAAWNSYAIAVSQLPFLLWAVTFVGILVAQIHFWSLRQRAFGGFRMHDVDEIIGFTAVALMAWILILRLGRGALVVGNRAAIHPLAAACEHCGYDLTHVSREGVCTECGHTAQDTLTTQRRSGVEWESGAFAGLIRRMAAWIRTSNELLLHPRSFYQRLHVTQPPNRAEQFAWMHYFALGVCSWAWMLTLFVSDQGTHTESTVVQAEVAILLLLGIGFALLGQLFWGVLVTGGGMFIVLLITLPFLQREFHGYFATTVTILTLISLGIIPICAWLVNRGIGGLMALWWFWRGYLHDERGAAKITAYESVYLWLPWLWFTLLFASFIFFDSWISELVASVRGIRRGMLAALVEPAVVLLGWTALAILWLFRFSRAAVDIRWANH